MRVRLADVGEIPEWNEIGRGGRFRSMRNTGSGSGGGEGGSGDDGGEGGEEDSGDGDEEESDEEPKAPTAEDFEKVKRTAARRDKALRAAQAEIAALRAAGEKKDEPDPVAKANLRLVNASARTALAAAGITDKEDQKAVLAVLDLSSIDVDEEDGPDEEEIEERVADLRRIFGGTAKKQTPGSRVPRGTTPKDKSNGSTGTDADSVRYRRILSGR